MAYYTERQKMELSLVECIVEPHHSINSSSSRSSDVTASSIESDGDAPVIVVSHSSSSSSSSPTGARRRENKTHSRRQPVNSASCQSSAIHAHMTRPHTGARTSSSHQLSTASKTSYHSEAIPQRRRSPTIEIVVDSDGDLEQRRSSDHRRRYHLRGRSANNHRPAPITTQSSQRSCAISKQVLQRCQVTSDERLADKYNELRSLLLNKLDLTTLTPQIRRQARQLIQRYYQGSSAPPGKFQRSMTLGNPIKESAGSQRPRGTVADRRVEAAGCSPMRNGRARVGVVMPQSAWDDTPLVSSAAVGRDRKTVTFLDDYTQHDSHRAAAQHPRDVDTSTSPTDHHHHQQQQQQQDTVEAADSDSEDSYSSDFNTDSSSDDEEHQAQEPGSEVPQLARSSDRRDHLRSGVSGIADSTQQRGRCSSANARKAVPTASYTEKPSRTRPSTCQGLRVSEGSTTGSRGGQKLGRSALNPDNQYLSLHLEDNKYRNVGRNVSPKRGRLRTKGRGRAQSGIEQNHDSAAPHSDSVKNDEDGGGRTDSRSSSSSSSSSKSAGGSPSRPVNAHSPVRTSSTLHEYHLKYTDNADIRLWLKSKNSELRRQRKERKRLERDRRRQQQEKQQAKEERHRESEMVVQRWMEEKRMESKKLNKRNQQNQKVPEHTHQGTDKEQDGQKIPGLSNQRGQKGSASKPAKNQDGKDSFEVKDGKSKVPLFSRLGKYDTFPGAGTWKTPGKKKSEVERRKAYGDWLRGNQAEEGLTTEDQDTSASVVDDHGNHTKSSSSVPPGAGQTSEKDRRCASATVGRRKKSESLSLRMQRRRPWSSKTDGIGTRLEPQGADHVEAGPEIDNTAVSKFKQDNAEDSSSGQGVNDVNEAEKDYSGYAAPHVSLEFEEDKKRPSFGQEVTPTGEDLADVLEEQKNSSEASDIQSGPKMRSSRDLMNIIKSKSRFSPGNSDGEPSRSNSNTENQERSSSARETAEDQEDSEERHEEAEERHSGEDEQRKMVDGKTTSGAESVRSSDNTDDDDDSNVLP